MEYMHRIADRESLERIWQKSVDRHPGDARWVRWRNEYIKLNEDGWGTTFIIFADGEPVGEGTLLFDPRCSAIGGRTVLADGGSVCNLNALRIEKQHEGKGLVSAMVKSMEAHARGLGYKTITIGVDECEARNRAIYAHWGYSHFILDEIDNGERVLYYGKTL